MVSVIIHETQYGPSAIAELLVVTARRYTSMVCAVVVCLYICLSVCVSVCLSHAVIFK